MLENNRLQKNIKQALDLLYLTEMSHVTFCKQVLASRPLRQDAVLEHATG